MHRVLIRSYRSGNNLIFPEVFVYLSMGISVWLASCFTGYGHVYRLAIGALVKRCRVRFKLWRV